MQPTNQPTLPTMENRECVAAGCYSVFIEGRESIHAAHVVLGLDDTESRGLTSKVNVAVYGSSIQVTKADSIPVNITIPDIGLIPKSCRILKWIPGEGLHMRFETRTKTDPSINGIIAVEELLDIREELEQLSNLTENQFGCRVCGANILRANSCFKRVRQLPSENWHEVIDDWCCHSTSEMEKMKKTSLVPKENDCFVGNLYICISVSDVQRDTLVCEETSNLTKSTNVAVVCQRCRTQLGEAPLAEFNERQGTGLDMVECVKFYKSCITFKGNQHLFKSYTLETHLSLSLRIQSILDTGFRYIVKSQSGKKPAIALLWLLNSDTRLITNCTKSNKAFQQLIGPLYHRHAEHKKNSLCSNTIMKILYKSCIAKQNEELIREWERDNTVHSIMFPHDSCHQLLLLLDWNNQHLPQSLRIHNDFKVSYLKLK